MVRLQLSIKAELENVTDLEPASIDFEFFFQVKCTTCHDIHPNYVSMNRIEEREVSGGKNSRAHFVWRCGTCKRENSAKFEPTVKPYHNENAQFAPLVVLDCRGLEFTGFNPMGVWKCVGTKGTIFSEVDLKESEWTDYDEKASHPVGVTYIESRWDRAPA